jgi:DNA-binding MarR family transcriptional regulator
MPVNPSILHEVKSLSILVGRQIENALHHDSEDNPTGMQGFIIGYLSDNKDADIFQRDVEAEFGIRRSTATGILQLMEKNGLVERHPVETDGRLKKLLLTDKAISLHENIMRIIHGIERTAEIGLSESEIEAFRTVLGKIQKNLGQGERY